MTPHPTTSLSPRLILRGIHLDLTAAMQHTLTARAARLLRHEPRILRLRLDVERSVGGRLRTFTAKGLVEVPGPDLRAAVSSADAYGAMSRLIARLDRMLRKRSTALLRRRVADDLRAHPGASAAR